MSDCQNKRVNLDEVQALLTEESLSLLDSLADLETPHDVVSLVSSLRAAGHPPERVHAVLGQIGLRKKSRDKFGTFADRLLVTPEGLEQATRLEVASHHAGRFERAGTTFLADCGCGIGGDSLAFAALGLDVTAIEADPATAALASYNLAPFQNADVVQSDVMDFPLEKFDALWIDPARRHGGTRSHNPEDWTPSLTWVFAQAKLKPSGIKLGPGFDHDLIPDGVEAQWVSFHGSVVELVLWSGTLARPGIARSALVIGAHGTSELTAPHQAPDQSVGGLKKFLYEPDGAIIRAQLIGDVARALDATMVDSTIAYMSSDSAQTSPFARGFEVLESAPYSTKNIQALLSHHSIGELEIKKRGIDVDPAALRNQLTFSGSDHRTLILTRLQGKKTAIIAKRMP